MSTLQLFSTDTGKYTHSLLTVLFQRLLANIYTVFCFSFHLQLKQTKPDDEDTSHQTNKTVTCRRCPCECVCFCPFYSLKEAECSPLLYVFSSLIQSGSQACCRLLTPPALLTLKCFLASFLEEYLPSLSNILPQLTTEINRDNIFTIILFQI